MSWIIEKGKEYLYIHEINEFLFKNNNKFRNFLYFNHDFRNENESLNSNRYQKYLKKRIKSGQRIKSNFTKEDIDLMKLILESSSNPLTSEQVANRDSTLDKWIEIKNNVEDEEINNNQKFYAKELLSIIQK